MLLKIWNVSAKDLSGSIHVLRAASEKACVYGSLVHIAYSSEQYPGDPSLQKSTQFIGSGNPGFTGI